MDLWRPFVLLVLGLFGVCSAGVHLAYGQAEGPSARRTRADGVAARADSLRGERAFDAAATAYRRARTLYRRIGADGRAAAMTGEVGAVAYRRGDLDTARQMFLRAADQARAAGAQAEAANNLNNVGLVQWRRGRYDAALTHIREAVAIHRELGNRKNVASGLNNIANIQEERGRYNAALENLRKALDVNRALGDSADVAMNLNNIGLVFRSQGQYEEARRHHRRALALHRRAGAEEEVADDLNNLGLVLRAQGRLEEALRRYQSALEMNKALGDRASVAANLDNIGTIHLQRGDHDAALEALREALRIGRSLDDQRGIAISLHEIATVRRHQGRPAAAVKSYRRALRINKRLGRPEGIVTNLHGLGLTHIGEGRYAAADSVLRRAVRRTETLLATATGESRRNFLAKEADQYQALVTARVRAGRPAAALRAFERGRAHLLARRLADSSALGDTSRAIPSVDSLQAVVGPGEAAVVYAGTGTPRPVVAFVVTSTRVIAREVADTAQVRSVQERYDGALRRLREGTRLGTVRGANLLRESGAGGDPVPGSSLLAGLVHLYRHDVSVPWSQQLLSTHRREHLGQHLREMLIGPLADELVEVEELIVIPSGTLGYLPFEALQDWDGAPLISQRNVRYAQSLRVLRLLRRRAAQTDDGTNRPLLALGGAVYDPDTYASDTTAGGPYTLSARTTTDSLRMLRRPGSGSLLARYGRAGYGPDQWPNLPGTLQEVRRLHRIAGGATLLTGRRASERVLQRWSRSGRLAEYQTVHFATHGLAMPAAPRLSALVLSDVADAPARKNGGRGLRQVDGYVNMREIADLRLDARFVALSACRTGVGRVYRGSGVVSLAQSFLQAGADAAAVSLWAVYDASTSRFMQAVYRRAWAREASWGDAIAATKRAFATGDHGERLRDPRFWAPFVHYGYEHK